MEGYFKAFAVFLRVLGPLLMRTLISLSNACYGAEVMQHPPHCPNSSTSIAAATARCFSSIVVNPWNLINGIFFHSTETQYPWYDGRGECNQTPPGNSAVIIRRKKVPAGSRTGRRCFDKTVSLFQCFCFFHDLVCLAVDDEVMFKESVRKTDLEPLNIVTSNNNLKFMTIFT